MYKYTKNRKINQYIDKLNGVESALAGFPTINNIDEISVDHAIAIDEKKRLKERIERESLAFGVKNPLEQPKVEEKNLYFSKSNDKVTSMHDRLLREVDARVLKDKPPDPWICGIDRRTGKPECTEYPDYHDELNEDEQKALRIWENNTSNYIKRLRKSNDIRAQKAWQNVQKLVLDIRASRKSQLDPTKSVLATNDNNTIRYYDLAFDPSYSDTERTHITAHEGWHSDERMAAKAKEIYKIRDAAERRMRLKELEKLTDIKAKIWIRNFLDKSYQANKIGYK